LERRVTMRQDAPRLAGSLATLWTIVLVGAALVQQLGVRLSTRTLRGTLGGLGLRWGRPQLALPRSTAPEKTHPPWVLAKAAVEVGSEAAMRDIDCPPGEIACLYILLNSIPPIEWNIEYTDELGAWWDSLSAEEQEEVNAGVILIQCGLNLQRRIQPIAQAIANQIDQKRRDEDG
jgi:hypothetical protein